MRVELVTPCEHKVTPEAAAAGADIPDCECTMLMTYGTRTTVSGFSPEAVQAAAWIIHRHRDPMGDLDLDTNCLQQARAALSAAWTTDFGTDTP